MSRIFILFMLVVSVSAETQFGLPDGFKARVFAKPPNVTFPVGIAASPEGDLYVSVDRNSSLSQFPNKGSIVKCSDTNGDGVADKFTKYVPDIDSPRNGCFVNGTLYLVHPPFLSSFKDTDGDGVADKRETLIKGMGFDLKFRGADHTSNGCRMGIDGWLYVAIGDYGMLKAVAKDGSTVHMHGGGVLRIKPDGTELEVFASNTRNIYDVGISPYMDIFTRDNTNDGKGWNTRFHHVTSMADMGYPRLYKNFSDEHMHSLADFGGGSGTGGLYIHEPGFPGKYGDMMYTCDFTTQQIYSHSMEKYEATFVTGQKTFFKTERAIDLDVDGNSNIYVCNFIGGKYRFEKKPVGVVYKISYPGMKPASYADVKQVSDAELVKLISSRSAVQRLNAQQQILERGKKKVFTDGLEKICFDGSSPLYSRVAAIYTLKHVLGAAANKKLAEISEDAAVREHAIKAMADSTNQLDGIHENVLTEGLSDRDPRVKLQAVIAIARLGKKSLAKDLLKLAKDMKSNDAQIKKLVDSVSAFQTYKHAPKELKLSISGKKTLYLIALGGHDGNKLDLGNWVDPVLTGPAGKKSLTELKWKSTSNVKTFVNKNAAGKPIKLKGTKNARKGIGTHADSVIVYEIPDGYTGFTVKATIDAETAKTRNGTIQFIVTTKSPDISNLTSADRHLAVPHTVCKAMDRLNAFETALQGLDNPATRQAAVFSLNQMHTEDAVAAIISRLKSTENKEVRIALLHVLMRIYQIDKKWNGKVWWTTKPDDRGPYFEPVKWSASADIQNAIELGFKRIDNETGLHLLKLLRKNRIDPSSFNLPVKEDPVSSILAKNEISEADARTLLNAVSEKRSREQLTAVFEALGKSKLAFEGQSLILNKWNSAGISDSEFRGRLKDFIYSPSHSQSAEQVLFKAKNSKGFLCEVSWKIALNLVNTPLTEKSVKAYADGKIKTSANSPELFKAMADMGIKTYKDMILKTAKSGSGKAKQAAADAAARLKLNSAGGKETKFVGMMKTKQLSGLLSTVKGDAKNGAQLFLRQGCIACHAVSMKQVQKGPFLGSAGSKFSKEYLIESIAEPGKVVAQGFQTTQFIMKDKSVHQGFVTSSVGDIIEVRNIAGIVTKINRKNVKNQQILKQSMMPPALGAGLTVKEFADLIAYLQSMKDK